MTHSEADRNRVEDLGDTDVYAVNMLHDYLWSVSANASIATQMLAGGDLKGCAYACRRMHAYERAALSALKLINDRRKAGAQANGEDKR